MSDEFFFFFFSSRRRHTRYWRDWSSDVCSSDLQDPPVRPRRRLEPRHPIARPELPSMNEDVVVNLVMQAMTLAFKVAMPLLGVALVLGLAVSVVQAVTQIQEQTLSFIPKIVGMALVLVVAGPWMLEEIITYTERLYSSIPTLVGG